VREKNLHSRIVVYAALSSPASEQGIVEGMGKKAVRGVVNVLTGVIELPAQTIKGYRNGIDAIDNEVGSKTLGTFIGLLRGVSHMAGRIYSGAFELAGFWTANPEDNEGYGVPFDDPYPWEEGVKYSIFDPSFKEGIKPYGRKFARGLGNALLGIAEIPGQTLRGRSEGNIFKGVGKGFWYFLSRQINGFGEVYTTFMPNHPDTMGVAFNGEWPWTVLSEEME